MVVKVSSMTSVSCGDKFRFEAAAQPDIVQEGKEKGEENTDPALTHSETLELFKFARVEYLCFFLDLVMLCEPLFELLPSREPRNGRP